MDRKIHILLPGWLYYWNKIIRLYLAEKSSCFTLMDMCSNIIFGDRIGISFHDLSRQHHTLLFDFAWNEFCKKWIGMWNSFAKFLTLCGPIWNTLYVVENILHMIQRYAYPAFTHSIQVLSIITYYEDLLISKYLKFSTNTCRFYRRIKVYIYV